jgi:hypothetical protein
LLRAAARSVTVVKRDVGGTLIFPPIDDTLTMRPLPRRRISGSRDVNRFEALDGAGDQPLGFFTAADVGRHDVHIHAACSEIVAGALELVTVASHQSDVRPVGRARAPVAVRASPRDPPVITGGAAAEIDRAQRAEAASDERLTFAS